MAAEVVESLELVIQTRADSAKEGIDKLATSVSDFGKAVEGYLESLYSFSDVLKSISEAANGLKGVQNIKNIISAVKSASASGKGRSGVGKVMAEAVSGQATTKVWKPVVPPTKASSTVKGKTRNVAWNGGVYQYNETADEIARNLNKGLNGTIYTNKEVSLKVQEIRQLILNGLEAEAMQMAKALAENLASSAGQNSVHPIVERMNGFVLSGNNFPYIGVDDTDISGAGMTIGEMNDMLRSLGARFGVRKKDKSNTKIGSFEDFDSVLSEFGVSSNVEDLFQLLKGQWTQHGSVLSERRARNNDELSAQVFDEIVDSVYSGKMIDAEAPARAAQEAVTAAQKAKEEAEEAAQYAKEAETAWKQFEREESKANREYKSENKLNWKEVGWDIRDNALAEAGVPMPDNTAAEIAGWNAMEDSGLASYQEELAEGWKQYAEAIVEAKTIAGSSIKDVIEEVTGLSRATKDAEDSARALMDALAETTPFKSAEESARTIRSELNKAEESANQLKIREMWDNDAAAIESYQRTRAERKQQEERSFFESALFRNSPEMISRSIESVGLEKFQELTNVPYLADKGVELGLISEETANAMKEAAGYVTEAREEMSGLGESARITAEQFMEDTTQADILQMKLEGVSQKLEEALNADETDPGKIARLANEYQNLKDKIEEVGDAANDASGQASGLGTALSNAANSIKSGTFGKLASQLWRVAKMRGLRYIIRSISSALSEGVNNLYSWSNGVNGSFADAMDTYSTKLSLIKNSVATAFSPLIEMAVPYISQLTSYVYSACNALSQFWALLTGSDTWTKALETTKKWSDTTKKGAGSVSDAADDTKDLLADWDELNVIQSDTTDSSGSGSSGSGSSVDYSKMFEDTSKFDTWTKYFTDIKDIVLDIATALLGWKLSEVLTGALGTLSSFVFTGATIKLVFDADTFFDNMYVDTGEEGWLVADLLTTILGSALATKALSSVLGGAAASIAVPLTFAVGAAATIKTLIDRTDVSALSAKGLRLAALTGLKTGAAAGYLFYTNGYTLLESIGSGAGVAVITLGVAVGLKAIAETIQTGELTEEILAADFLSAGAVGGGLFLMEKALGGSTITAFTQAGGGALVTFGVLIGLEAVADVIGTGAITGKTWAADIASALTTGTGLGLLVKTFTDASVTQAITIGAGGALATFGVLLGLETVYESIEAGKITKDTLLKDVGSAITTGGGLGLIAYTGFKASITEAITLGGGAALATFGLMLGVETVYETVETGKITEETLLKDIVSALGIAFGVAFIAGTSGLGTIALAAAVLTVEVGAEMAIVLADKEEPISWGNLDLTEAEVQAYVNRYIFKTDPQIHVSLLKTSVTNVSQARTKLQGQISAALKDLMILRVSLTSDNLETLENDVFGADGLVEGFKSYAKTQETLIETTFHFVQKKETENGEGKDGTDQTAENALSGWKELTGIMDQYSKDLTKAFEEFDKAVDDDTRNSKAQTIAKITQMMTDIANAVTYGQEMAKIQKSFDEFSASLSDTAAEDIVDYFNEQKEAIVAARLEALEATATSSLELSYAYKYLAENEKDENKKKEYEEKAKQLYADYYDMINNAQQQAEEEAVEKIRNTDAGKKVKEEWLNKINSPVDANDMGNAFLRSALNLFIDQEDTFSGFEAQMNETGETLKERINGALYGALVSAFGEENAYIYAGLVESGILDWSDLISDDAMNSLIGNMFANSDPSDEFRTEFTAWMKKNFGFDVEIPVKVKPDTEEVNKRAEQAKKEWEDQWSDWEKLTQPTDLFGNIILTPEFDTDGQGVQELIGDEELELGATLNIDEVEFGEGFEDLYGDFFWDVGGVETPDTPSVTNPEDGLTVDAETSGMALDSTIQMTGSTVGSGFTLMNNLLEAMKKVMTNVEENTKKAANKELTVTINPSTAFGLTGKRSNRNVELVTGNA